MYVQTIADRVAQHLESISKTFPTKQNSARVMYDDCQVINGESHENPGTPGTKLKVFRNNLRMLRHTISIGFIIQIYKKLIKSKRFDSLTSRALYEFKQCVAVCCSVLQSVAVCCRVLQCVAVCCSVLQCVAVCCNL